MFKSERSRSIGPYWRSALPRRTSSFGTPRNLSSICETGQLALPERRGKAPLSTPFGTCCEGASSRRGDCIEFDAFRRIGGIPPAQGRL